MRTGYAILNISGRKGSDAVFFWIAMIALVVVLVVMQGKEQVKNPRKYTVMRCPTCGAEARNYGTSWECTWCGDFGTIRKQ